MKRVLAIGIGLAAVACGQTAEEFFEARVRPVLAEKCQSCHNAKHATAGLDLSTAAGFRKGADTGPIVDADWEKSRLLSVISYVEKTKMPPTGRLRDSEIAALRDWVKAGAPWPGGAPETPAARRERATPKTSKHWAFQPLRTSQPPAGLHPVDWFLNARRAEKQLPAAPPADKPTHLRRAAVDLTGLPPAAAVPKKSTGR